MVRQVLLAGIAGSILASSIGCNCQRCFRRPLHDRDTSGADRGPYLGDPVAPPAGSYIAPPPGGLPIPSADGGIPPPSLPSSPSPSRFDPANPPAEIVIPDSPTAKSGGIGPELMRSNSQSTRILGDPVRVAGYAESVKKSGPTAGVAGFAVVKDGVATGRKPALDGWDALKSAGYKTAVYLHEAGADTSAVKEQAERRGLTFVSIPVTAEKFEDAMTRFQSLVNDKPARPIYVFDDNGVRTGSLWYAYLRTVDFLGSDEARVKAAAFGLKDPPSSEQQSFWVAVQKYVATR